MVLVAVLAMALFAGVAVVIVVDDDGSTGRALQPARWSTTTTRRAPSQIPKDAIAVVDLADFLSVGHAWEQQSLAVASGSLWLASYPGLVRVNATTGAVASIPVEAGRRVVGTDGGVWTLSECPRVLRFVSSETNTVTQTLDLPVQRCGPFDRKALLAVGAGSVWVLDGHSLFRVDPATGDVATIALPDGWATSTRTLEPADIVGDDHGVWIGFRGVVRYVSAGTNTVTYEHDVETNATFGNIALGQKALWITTIYPVLPTTFELTQIENGRVTGSATGFARVYTANGSLWFIGYYPEPVETQTPTPTTLRVGQLDPRTLDIVRYVDVPHETGVISAVAVAADDALWIGTDRTLQRIPST
jgi:streptogramin lyase